MARRLPPLNSLRAFEAAARHLSFTLAADELNVTQAAVSHQIKSLEEHLGTPLFHRLNRALRLTDAGLSLYPPHQQRSGHSCRGGQSPAPTRTIRRADSDNDGFGGCHMAGAKVGTLSSAAPRY